MWISVLLSVLAFVQTKSINETIIIDNSHWQELANFTVDNSEINVSKYKSSLTGKRKHSLYFVIKSIFAFVRFDNCCCKS